MVKQERHDKMKLIQINEQKKIFLLNTLKSSYAFAVSPAGDLVHLWFGTKMRMEDLPGIEDARFCEHWNTIRQKKLALEYPVLRGGSTFSEVCLQAQFANGSRDAALSYQDYRTVIKKDRETLIIRLAEPRHGLEIELHYTVYSDSAIIDRQAVLRNTGNEKIQIDQLFSAALQFPFRDEPYRITHCYGRWAAEGQFAHTNLEAGSLAMDSRSGLSGPFAVPFFAADDGHGTENSGSYYFGTLQWSGNWKIVMERTPLRDTVISGGLNDFDFAMTLESGAELAAPVFSFGYTENGFGGVYTALQNHFRRHLEPECTRNKAMPFVCNTYGAYRSGPDMNEENTLKTIKLAAEIGCELFVFDAGWQQTFGDWIPHAEKFSGTLHPHVELAHKLGMKFGVWAELECADENSSIFRDHKDWFMQFPDEFPRMNEVDGPDPAGKRRLLDLSKPEVCEYIFQALDHLIGEYHLDYFKLDMNRSFSQPGKERSLWYDYVKGLYSIFERIRAKYPDLIFENCACGNFRGDWGFNRFASRNNRSDNQEGVDMLKLHEGFNLLALSKMAGGGCHLSDSYFRTPNHREMPRKFQAFAGMMGCFSCSIDLVKASPELRTEIKAYSDLYKELRETVHNGIFHRIYSHFEHPYAGYEYVREDGSEAVLFVFAHSLQFWQRVPPFRFIGLDRTAAYKVEIFGDPDLSGSPTEAVNIGNRTGEYLCSCGINLKLHGDTECRIIRVRRIV